MRFHQHLYLKLCAILIASLAGFVAVAMITWLLFGHAAVNRVVFEKSAALTELLLHDNGQSIEQLQIRLQQIHEKLDINAVVYSASATVIAGVGQWPATLTDHTTIPTGNWIRMPAANTWATQMSDGRYTLLELSGVEQPRERLSVLLFLLGGIACVSLATYPFVRRLTSRIERLQAGVEQMATGTLSARVAVEGQDEVAKLASSFNHAMQSIENLVGAHKLLLANASHELRTPIARLRLGIEMLRDNYDESRLDDLVHDIGELDQMIGELTALSRIEAGDLQHEFASFDLLATVAEECAHYRDCVIHGFAGEITGHRRMVQRAVRNLLDNAQKHGVAPIEVTLQQSPDTVTITICDQGTINWGDDPTHLF